MGVCDTYCILNSLQYVLAITAKPHQVVGLFTTAAVKVVDNSKGTILSILSWNQQPNPMVSPTIACSYDKTGCVTYYGGYCDTWEKHGKIFSLILPCKLPVPQWISLDVGQLFHWYKSEERKGT